MYLSLYVNYLFFDIKMKQLILASNNSHKIKEFREIFTDCEILSLSDI